MINGPLLSIIILIIVVMFFVIDFGFMNRYDRERETRKGWSWDYTLFTVGMGLVVVLQPWLLPSISWSSAGPFGIGVQILGGILILGSFAVHIWARQHLRQFYVERVEVQNKHQVIQTGPYAYVRHPIISTFFSLAFGLLLLNPSIVTLAVMIYIFWDFSRAALQEEELLTRSLPDYAAYMAQTPRFMPKLGKKS
ncbi:MAG: isoprenylcysteine carboxylmethyltransferase family protein [Chloroflexi bacterium]|nr:isoprenylcysteine carboxylmethyltransferase family protein [Chloroflexota bacterium]